jgi:hypothetical protein
MNKFTDENWQSPIPKHLTPEERKEWEENLEWERQELERRKKEGFYDEKPKKKVIGWKLIQKLFKGK